MSAPLVAAFEKGRPKQQKEVFSHAGVGEDGTYPGSAEASGKTVSLQQQVMKRPGTAPPGVRKQVRHPYRLPFAVDRKRCPKCPVCASCMVVIYIKSSSSSDAHRQKIESVQLEHCVSLGTVMTASAGQRMWQKLCWILVSTAWKKAPIQRSLQMHM